MSKKQPDPNHISFGRILLWSMPGISNAMYMVLTGYITLYCSTILGLNIALVSTLLLASKIFDCFSDLVIGYVIDHTNTRLGRGRPYDICIAGAWICLLLLFSCVPTWTTFWKCVYILVIYILMNSGFASLYACANVPYMVRAFNNNNIYVKLGSYGGLISMLGGVAVNVIFPQLMVTHQDSASGWRYMILVFAIPGIILGMVRFFTCPEKYSIDVRNEHSNIKEMIHSLVQNKYVFLLAFVMLVYNIVYNMNVQTYYFKYVIGDLSMMSLFSMVSLVMVPVMLVFPPLLKHTGIGNVIKWGFISCMIGCAINWFAKDNAWIYFIGAAFTGIGVVPVSMMSSLLNIDCADYNEWKGMPRMEATIGSVMGFMSNFGSALGGWILGILLSLGGFIETVEGQSVVQPASVTLTLRLLISFVPMALYAIAVILLQKYDLEKKMPQIRKELNERRAAAAAANADGAQ